MHIRGSINDLAISGNHSGNDVVCDIHMDQSICVSADKEKEGARAMGFTTQETCLQCGETSEIPKYAVMTKLGNFEPYICFVCRNKNAKFQDEHTQNKKQELIVQTTLMHMEVTVK